VKPNDSSEDEIHSILKSNKERKLITVRNNTNTNTNILLILLILIILILVYIIYRRAVHAKRTLTEKIKPNRIFILFSCALLSSRRDAVFYLYVIYLFVCCRAIELNNVVVMYVCVIIK